MGSTPDIVSLQAHQCYVRATVGGKRQPAYSVHVLAPEEGDPEVAARIRAGMSAYTTSAETIAQWESEVERVVPEEPKPRARGAGKKKQQAEGAAGQPKKKQAKQQSSNRTSAGPVESE